MAFRRMTLQNGVVLHIPLIVRDYEFIRVLSEGAAAIVCLVKSRHSDIFHVCKVVPRVFLESETVLRHFERELRILQTIRHPNVVILEDVIYETDFIFLIMEYCQGGDLLEFIQACGSLSPADARRIFRAIIAGIEHLHANDISHRDIKPDNILLDSAGTPKIADFGLSLDRVRDRLAETPCGSIEYCAPEVIGRTPYDGRRADVWSLGVLLYAMLAGRLPWRAGDASGIYREAIAGDFDGAGLGCEGARALVARMIRPDPAARPSIAEVLADPWIAVPDYRPRGINESRSTGVIQKKLPVLFRGMGGQWAKRPQFAQPPVQARGFWGRGERGVLKN
jgi:5'-AMP-activated protein kinase catalytic alpha subunit